MLARNTTATVTVLHLDEPSGKVYLRDAEGVFEASSIPEVKSGKTERLTTNAITEFPAILNQLEPGFDVLMCESFRDEEVESFVSTTPRKGKTRRIGASLHFPGDQDGILFVDSDPDKTTGVGTSRADPLTALGDVAPLMAGTRRLSGSFRRRR